VFHSSELVCYLCDSFSKSYGDAARGPLNRMFFQLSRAFAERISVSLQTAMSVSETPCFAPLIAAVNHRNALCDFILGGELCPLNVEKVEKWLVILFGSATADLEIHANESSRPLCLCIVDCVHRGKLFSEYCQELCGAPNMGNHIVDLKSGIYTRRCIWETVLPMFILLHSAQSLCARRWRSISKMGFQKIQDGRTAHHSIPSHMRSLFARWRTFIRRKASTIAERPTPANKIIYSAYWRSAPIASDESHATGLGMADPSWFVYWDSKR
jgi:hypothetical protein